MFMDEHNIITHLDDDKSPEWVTSNNLLKSVHMRANV